MPLPLRLPPPRRPRVVIVEDGQLFGEALQEALTNPPGEFQQRYGIPGCDVVLVTSLASATAVFRAAREAGRPYDVALVDLGLPATDDNLNDGGQDNPERGIQLLEDLDDQSCRAYVVMTMYADKVIARPGSAEAESALSGLVRHPHVVRFLDKLDSEWDADNEVAFRAVADAFKQYRERCHREWVLVERRHQERRAALSRLASLDQLSRTAGSGFSRILDVAEELTKQVESRLKISVEADRNDSLSRGLLNLRQTIRDASAAYESDRSRLESGRVFGTEQPDELLSAARLETISPRKSLLEAVGRLHPAADLYNVAIQVGESSDKSVRRRAHTGNRGSASTRLRREGLLLH